LCPPLAIIILKPGPSFRRAALDHVMVLSASRGVGMTSSEESYVGRVLVLDDDSDFQELYRENLEKNLPGLQVRTAANRQDAVKALRRGRLDIVIADMVIARDAEGGYETILELKNADPSIEVIAITQVTNNVSQAVRCMRAGCLDYLDKAEAPEVLRDRVKQALALARSGERRRTLVEQLILADWEMVLQSNDKKRKGRYLESLMALLFGSIPGWHVKTNQRSDREEFDLVIRNELDDIFWMQRGNFILVECKHWSAERPPERDVCDAFYAKIQRRSPEYCRLGIFVSMMGVSKGFETEASRPSEGGRPVIVILDKDRIWDLICAPDRSHWLKDRVQERVFG
jgi:DNA-binding response OmpR family regulator